MILFDKYMMSIINIFKLYLALQCFVRINYVVEGFAQEDEAEYINSFDTLIKDSYSAPLPQDLVTACKNQNQATISTVQSITTSMLSSDLQAFCGTETICTIPAGLTVTMNSNLNVAALVVSGSLIWNDASQSSSNQWLCAGYIAVSTLL